MGPQVELHVVMCSLTCNSAIINPKLPPKASLPRKCRQCCITEQHVQFLPWEVFNLSRIRIDVRDMEIDKGFGTKSKITTSKESGRNREKFLENHNVFSQGSILKGKYQLNVYLFSFLFSFFFLFV